jgi:hypothetical protein
MEVRVPDTGFEVAPGTLRAAAGAAGSVADELRQLTGGLNAATSDAAAVVGQPVAAGAVLDFAASWTAHLLVLEQLLVGLGDGLAVSAAAYETTDAAAAGSLAGSGRLL